MATALLVHRLRGRVSNRRIDAQTQARAMALLKQAEWHDFGATFASEQLVERHGLEVSKETVRTSMLAAELWKAQRRQLGEAHFWRARRSGYGELVQWDTSNHDWLEGRGEPVRYLVRMIEVPQGFSQPSAGRCPCCVRQLLYRSGARDG
jgi:hypothetical protein